MEISRATTECLTLLRGEKTALRADEHQAWTGG